MNFDMNRTWAHCVSLVQANFQLLAVLAGVFILIPNLIFYIAVPDVMMEAAAGAAEPDRMVELLQENMVPLVGFGLLAIFAQFTGYAAMVGLMGSNRPTVGESLRQALGAIPTLLGVTVLMMLAYVVVALGLALVVGLIGALLSYVAGPAAVVLVTVVALVGVFAAIIYVLARFIMVYPAVMLEDRRNPIAAISRSLVLTKPHSRRIFLFLTLLFVAYFVISLIVGSIFGLLIAGMGGGPGAAFASGLINGVLGSAVALFYAGVMVAMYKQLAGTDTSDIGETFE